MENFNYHRPATVNAAVTLLKKSKGGSYMAGGHTLLPTMKQGLASPSDIIDLSAIKGAIRALERGMAFGIFPEGTRSRTGKLQPFKTGVAAIALRTGSPVVPVAVVGTEEAWPVGKKLFRPCRAVRVIYGDPIPVPRKSKVSHRELEALTREIEARVRDLLPPRYWGS